MGQGYFWKKPISASQVEKNIFQNKNREKSVFWDIVA